MNDNGAKWKQLANMAEAEKNILLKHLNGQALFTGMRRLYAALHMEMKGSLQLSGKKVGQHHIRHKEYVERWIAALEMRAAPGRRGDHLRFTKNHGRWQQVTSLCQ
jgi:hypothetical protein